MSFRSLFVALALMAASTLSAFSAERQRYDEDAFLAAQRADRPILVEITAPWCQVCAAQRPIISRLSARPEFRDLIVFEVDYDTQKEAVRYFNARQQSTLIVYEGREEVDRSVGETDISDIEDLIRAAY